MSEMRINYQFIQYLVNQANQKNGADQLPPLSKMSKELGVSVSYLREQLEVAKALGLVEARPRTGIRRLPFSFLPAVFQSASYAIAVQPDLFWHFSDLRIHIEVAYWNEAVKKLCHEDQQALNKLLEQAWNKLRGHPIEIPHWEHR
jgi:DNA-binding FadR family transcriptional regulator